MSAGEKLMDKERLAGNTLCIVKSLDAVQQFLNKLRNGKDRASRTGTLIESLILAQDERWRRA